MLSIACPRLDVWTDSIEKFGECAVADYFDVANGCWFVGYLSHWMDGFSLDFLLSHAGCIPLSCSYGNVLCMNQFQFLIACPVDGFN